MNNPTFHLEGVVRNKNEMQDFSGPLSLILMLLSKNKIEIRDLKISEILDQYLEHIAKLQEMDLDLASEFVQMASHLVYLKTKTLLVGEEEVSELEELLLSLEQLKCREAFTRIQTVVPTLSAAAEQGALLFSKNPEPLRVSTSQYQYSHEPHELLSAILSVISRGSPAKDPEERGFLVPKRIIFSVNEKCGQLLTLFQDGKSRSLRELILMSGTRSEVIATFISVLELCSMGTLEITDCEGEPSVSVKPDADMTRIPFEDEESIT